MKKSLRTTIKELFSRHAELNTFEIKKLLGVDELSTIGRRVSELKNEGLIFQTERFTFVKGKKYFFYELTPEDKIEEVKQLLWLLKKEAFIKSGIKKGYLTVDNFTPIQDERKERIEKMTIILSQQKEQKKEKNKIPAYVKCNCGHPIKDHYKGGWCHNSGHPNQGACGCTYFYPNDRYILNQQKKEKPCKQTKQ